jgi:hypothetical protein
MSKRVPLNITLKVEDMGSPLNSSSWLRMHQITSVTYIYFRRDTRVTMTARMPPIEKTDYPALDMGHSFSRTDISIVGLEVQVYGLEEIKGSSKPIVGLVSSLPVLLRTFLFNIIFLMILAGDHDVEYR